MPAWPWDHWTSTYADAERAARSSGRGMIVYYREKDTGVADPMFDALRSPNIAKRTRSSVTCALSYAYEPNRRFVQQFGVDRAPALIVIHPDGTYHARTGPQSVDQIARFLEEAQPPGLAPALNPHLSRAPAYTWFTSLDAARAASQRTGQSILVVLDRWYARDWERLRAMLERREVFTRFADMIHCRPSSLWGGIQAASKEFAIANLPALVIVRPDGTHDVLELPHSYESIVRFADGVQAGQREVTASSALDGAGPR